MAGNTSFDQDKNQLAEDETSSTGSSGGSGALCYNSRTGEYLGRTPLSWIKLSAFLVLFSTIIAVLWGLCMGIFFQTLHFYIPHLRLEQSIIGTNPGLGYRPAGGLGFKSLQGEYKVTL